MDTNKTFSPYPAFIPPDVCRFLGLEQGDAVRFELRGGDVIVKKSELPLDMSEPGEHEYMALVEASFAPEWLSAEDEEAFKNW